MAASSREAAPVFRSVLLAAALFTSGCAALAGTPEFGHRRAMFDDEQAIPDKDHNLCKVYVVDSVPDGAKRVGTIDVPVEDARARRVDESSRHYACDLNATHAVKEEEITDKRGRQFWKMSVYRVPKSLF